ncbi:hypothetical protein DW1_1142 [Proteiniborus sp. DW1]|uniref:hypothetical protein n=1 Tax=Proteiniborus sp. DW1 TaxID=1889883 RepID=UPI00092E0659|nr:hypothetical protein [Proteiniborus sp. DW1]SCG82715.1 hypothetical protein DW1_1142 [Proteiniborus sp. DW1]
MDIKECCKYCMSIYTSTPASPKRKYKFCPMCGEKLDFSRKVYKLKLEEVEE